jgi:hypothetical protein
MEGAGIGVGLGEEAVDGCLKLDDGSEYPPLETSLGQLGEEAFDGIEP